VDVARAFQPDRGLILPLDAQPDSPKEERGDPLAAAQAPERCELEAVVLDGEVGLGPARDHPGLVRVGEVGGIHVGISVGTNGPWLAACGTISGGQMIGRRISKSSIEMRPAREGWGSWMMVPFRATHE